MGGREHRGHDADDAPQLLSRLSNKVGGLTGPGNHRAARARVAALPTRHHKGTRHLSVRGMLLYGPPGCGKTLLAREITSALGARGAQEWNGAEMMSKVCMHASRQKGTCSTQCKPTVMRTCILHHHIIILVFSSYALTHTHTSAMTNTV